MARIPRGQLYDQNKYLLKKQHMVDLTTFIQPVGLVDPTSPDLPQVFEGDRLKTQMGGEMTEGLLGEAGVGLVQIAVPADETWRVSGIHFGLDTDANAANRVMTINVHQNLTMGLVAANDSFVVPSAAATTIVANTVGQVSVSEGQSVWVNNNGVTGYLANEGFLPLTLNPLSVINGEYTNAQVGDLGALDVIYRVV
jgi:hypothetical protein